MRRTSHPPKGVLPPDSGNPQPLNDALMREIFSYLDLSSLFASRWVSHRWKHLYKPWGNKLVQVRKTFPYYLNKRNVMKLVEKKNPPFSKFRILFSIIDEILSSILSEPIDDQIDMLTRFIKIKEGSLDESALHNSFNLLMETAWAHLEEAYQSIPRMNWRDVTFERSLNDDTKHYFLTYLTLATLNLNLFKVFREPESENNYCNFLPERKVIFPIDDSDILREVNWLESENAALFRAISRKQRLSANAFLVSIVSLLMGGSIILLKADAKKKEDQPSTIVAIVVPFLCVVLSIGCCLIGRRLKKQYSDHQAQSLFNEKRLRILKPESRERQYNENDIDTTSQSNRDDYQLLVDEDFSSMDADGAVVSYGTFER